jgi:hypothetical protein
MSSVSTIELAIRKDPNTDRNYIPVDTVQFPRVNSVSLKSLVIPGGDIPTISDVIFLKYKEAGVAQLAATTATNFANITAGLPATDPLLVAYCFAITIAGLPLVDSMQPHNGTFYITAAYQDIGGDYVLELANPSITTNYFDILNPDTFDAATFTIGVADYYQIFEQIGSEQSTLNGLCHGQYVEAYLPERYLALDPDTQNINFSGTNMIMYADLKRYSAESPAMEVVELKWDAVEEKVYLLTNLLDAGGQDQFNLIKIGDRLRVELLSIDPEPDIRLVVTSTVDKLELIDVTGNKYGKIWFVNQSISDATYDYAKAASGSPDEYVQIGDVYTSRRYTLLFVDGQLTSRIHDADVTIDTNENLIIPGQYYDLSFLNSESFKTGATNTASAIISSSGGVVDAAITEKPSGGGFAIDMYYGDLVDMMLEAAMGGQWTEKMVTNNVLPIAASDIIEMTDTVVAEQLRVGYPVRLSGSNQTRTINQTLVRPNNGIFIISAIQSYGPVYRFKLAKSLDAPLLAGELFLEEPVNDNYALQCSVCENGLRSSAFKVEKIEHANIPFITLYSGQTVQAMNVTLGEKAIITMDVTFDGTGYEGLGRTFPYKGTLVRFLDKNIKVISAASENNIFVRNGVATILNSFTWSAKGLTDVKGALGTPFARTIARNPLDTETKYSLEFDSFTTKQKYLRGCLEQDLLFTIGNSPQCEDLQEEDAYTYYSARNVPANLDTGTKAKTGQLMLDFQSGFEKIRKVGDPYYGYRNLVCNWSRFDKVV